MNILVILWGALGDMLVATPALRALRERYPQARITFVSNALMTEIAPPGTLADTVIACAPEQLKSIVFTVRLGCALAKEHFDLAINLRYTSERSALLTWLSRAKMRIGAGPARWMWCYTMRLPYPRSHYNELFRYRDIIKAIGVSVEDMRPFVFQSPSQKAFGEESVREVRGSHEPEIIGSVSATMPAKQIPIVCLHPGASKPYRAWRPERYAEIGRRIIENHRAMILVTWADHERDVAECVVREIGGGAALAPRTPSIGYLAALYTHCAMVICNNSGAMHVAVAADVPVVALTGATELEDWEPVGEKHRSIKSPKGGLPPSPESEREVMDALAVNAVWDAVHTRLCEILGMK